MLCLNMQIRNYVINYVQICIYFKFINMNGGGGYVLGTKYNKNIQNIHRNKTVKLKEVDISCFKLHLFTSLQVFLWLSGRALH